MCYVETGFVVSFAVFCMWLCHSTKYYLLYSMLRIGRGHRGRCGAKEKYWIWILLLVTKVEGHLHELFNQPCLTFFQIHARSLVSFVPDGPWFLLWESLEGTSAVLTMFMLEVGFSSSGLTLLLLYVLTHIQIWPVWSDNSLKLEAFLSSVPSTHATSLVKTLMRRTRSFRCRTRVPVT